VRDPADTHFAAITGDIAAGLAELLTAKAERERRPLEPLDLFDVAGALLGASYSLAKLAGVEHRPAWVEIVRRHADAIEGTVGEHG
jgi:hypothetical protein